MSTNKKQLPTLTNEMLSATNAYLMARSLAETLKPVIRQIESDLLKEMPINYDPKYSAPGNRMGGDHCIGRITNPDELYLADLDSPEVAAYWDALEIKKQERFPDPARPKGHCPYCVADHQRLIAENLMIDTAVSLHGHKKMTHDTVYGDDRKQLVHLILGLVINHPQFKAPKL